MTRKPPLEDKFWPLGGLEYSHEVNDFFPDEAQIIGAITIMWNRQDLALLRLFKEIVGGRARGYTEAIWDRQPTHQARRDLLALAIEHGKLTKRQVSILTWIIDKTKTIADRRNELIHAEYVVNHRTDVLYAKIKSPRSIKPPKHQKVSAKDLQSVVSDLNHLLQVTESAWLEFLWGRRKTTVRKIGQELVDIAQSLQNRRSD